MLNKRGFSLIEVSVWIFILAIVFGLVGTSFSKYTKSSAIRVQQEIITADLALAKTIGDCTVNFYEDGYVLRQGLNHIKQVKLQPNFTVSPALLGFTSKGTPSYAGTVYLYYRGQQVAKMTVAVGSGLVHWTRL